VAFDALEFDEGLATIDLGYDLAFLLMDLCHRVGRAAANLVLNRYVARGGDAALMVGLPLFLSLRAMVRAHVVAASGGSAVEVGAYLDDADAALAPGRPVVVAIGGLPGTGKSTLAAALAPDLGAAPGALILRSDAIRKRLHGTAPEQRLAAVAYGPDANRATDAALVAGLRDALAGRHPVILDATFMDPGLRAAVQAQARAAGVGFVGLWLAAPMAVLEQRVGARVGDASDADVAVLRAAAARDPGPGQWRAIDATDAAVALAAVAKLAGVAGRC
jgi:predicted kinase